jgi:excisionase family DNA binding protein
LVYGASESYNNRAKRIKRALTAQNDTETIMTQFLTPVDLAKLLQVPLRSIYNFAQQGKIPGAFKVGKHWRFREDMIEQWIEEKTRPKYRTSESIVANEN